MHDLFKVKIIHLGYTYSESWKYYIDHKDGNKTAWSTISYANGDGFMDHFTGNPEHPWKDIRNMDFTADDYRQGDYKDAPQRATLYLAKKSSWSASMRFFVAVFLPCYLP